jgi:hypothetical protein
MHLASRIEITDDDVNRCSPKKKKKDDDDDDDEQDGPFRSK